jgi:hypothetical protein
MSPSRQGRRAVHQNELSKWHVPKKSDIFVKHLQKHLQQTFSLNIYNKHVRLTFTTNIFVNHLHPTCYSTIFIKFLQNVLYNMWTQVNTKWEELFEPLSRHLKIKFFKIFDYVMQFSKHWNFCWFNTWSCSTS